MPRFRDKPIPQPIPRPAGDVVPKNRCGEFGGDKPPARRRRWRISARVSAVDLRTPQYSIRRGSACLSVPSRSGPFPAAPKRRPWRAERRPERKSSPRPARWRILPPVNAIKVGGRSPTHPGYLRRPARAVEPPCCYLHSSVAESTSEVSSPLGVTVTWDVHWNTRLLSGPGPMRSDAMCRVIVWPGSRKNEKWTLSVAR